MATSRARHSGAVLPRVNTWSCLAHPKILGFALMLQQTLRLPQRRSECLSLGQVLPPKYFSSVVFLGWLMSAAWDLLNLTEITCIKEKKTKPQNNKIQRKVLARLWFVTTQLLFQSSWRVSSTCRLWSLNSFSFWSLEFVSFLQFSLFFKMKMFFPESP